MENPNGGVREFVRVLKLHQEYPAELVEKVITQALKFGCIHVDGVKLCLHQIQHPAAPIPPLQHDSNQAYLFQVGS